MKCKQFFSVFFILLMVLSVPVFSLAEAEKPDYTKVDVSMMDETGYDGTWQTIGNIYRMYIPDGWAEKELSDPEKATGVLSKLCDPSGKFLVETTYLSPAALEAAGLTDLGTIRATLENDKEIVDTTLFLINGIPCVNYYLPSADVIVTGFFADSGHFIQISMAPGSDEDFIPTAMNMFYSLSPYTEEENAVDAES